MNLCRECNTDFGSVQAFDLHRVGKHAYTYSEGLKFDPPVEDGRRCLSESEMLERGLVKNQRGTWSLEVSLVSARDMNAVAPEKSDTETLHCEKCDKDFERKVSRGRKPKLCPDCKEA